jgi:hypothetical protein
MQWRNGVMASNVIKRIVMAHVKIFNNVSQLAMWRINGNGVMASV